MSRYVVPNSISLTRALENDKLSTRSNPVSGEHNKTSSSSQHHHHHMYKSIMITAMNPIFVIQIIISTTLLVNQLCTPSLYAVAAPTAPLVGHLVPHSHCDAANEKTPDEYYRTQVRTILSSIVTALNEDSNRKFIWSETIFLEKWFHEVVDLGDGGEKIELSSPYLSEEEQTFQKQLRWDFLRHYQNENIEIVNGGWV